MSHDESSAGSNSPSTSDPTQEQRAILTAIAARILPSDEGPGAAETGVSDYLHRAVRDRLPAEVRELFRQQLTALDQAARDSQDRCFAACPPGIQDTLLKRWSEEDESPARWVLSQLVGLCLEGFLGDPRHGGNQGRLGWSYVGLEGENAPDACMLTHPQSANP